jgi:anthranilate synthase component 1
VTAVTHWRTLAAFPDPLRLHQQAPARFPFLLESAVPPAGPRPATARYDLLLGDPGLTLCARADGQVELDGEARPGDFLSLLAELRRERAPQPPTDFPAPFWGGFFVYLAYEFAGALERLPAPKGPFPGPQAYAVEVGSALIRDHQTQQTIVVASGPEASERVAGLADWVAAAEEGPWQGERASLPAVVEDDPAAYREAVRRGREYIQAGDVFQVNLARAWEAPLTQPLDSAALYDRLRRANPGPFSGLARLPDGATLLSSSPERLVAVHGDTAETRPIAGTRPRGAGEGEDRALSGELRRHPKERAEHVMLIDLERNDLGRVCAPGTVEVDEFMALESYAHVHHITSNVRGRLAQGQRPEEAIRALFPGGTITGCPKVRCMEIIHELERRPRGAYTGSMGYLGYDGTTDLNILIRTLVQTPDHLEFLTGAGIVADSDPQRELEETRAKARGLLRALAPDADGPEAE